MNDELKAALERYDATVDLVRKRHPELDVVQPVPVIIEAARKWANLTSPETIRDVLNVRLHQLIEVQEPCETACTHWLWGEREFTALGLANVLHRAVLRAVEEEI